MNGLSLYGMQKLDPSFLKDSTEFLSEILVIVAQLAQACMSFG